MSAYNAGDLGSIPGLGRSPGEGKGYLLYYSGLENSLDCIVHGVTKSRTQPCNFPFHANSMFNHLSKCQTAFQSGSNHLQSKQQGVRAVISLLLLQHVLLIWLFNSSYPNGIWNGSSLWFRVAIFWLVMMSNTFAYAYWAFVYFLQRNIYSETFPIFELDYSSFCYWDVKALYILQIQVSCQIHDSPLLTLISALSFHFLDSVLEAHTPNFDEVQFTYIFSFVVHATSVLHKNPLSNLGIKIYPYIFL